jgi:RimJ/RimL family protein N-acetyltransferase
MMLTTDRLRLRQPVLGDFDAFAAMWAEEDVCRHTTGAVQTRAESWARFQKTVGGWALLGYGLFSVFDTAGQYLGQAGMFHGLRGLGQEFDTAAEVGWTFTTAASGQGYASEALQAVQHWFDSQNFAARTVCMIVPDHAASLRVAEKCGFSEFARTDYAETPVVLLQRACQSSR